MRRPLACIGESQAGNPPPTSWGGTSYGSWYDNSDDNRDDNCSPNNGRYGPILGVSCLVTHCAWSWRFGDTSLRALHIGCRPVQACGASRTRAHHPKKTGNRCLSGDLQ